MNWIKRIFNWKKSPKSTNGWVSLCLNGYNKGLDYKIPDEFFTPNIWDEEERKFIQLRMFINESYWKVKYSWKRSPKNYYVWIADDGIIELRKYNTPNGIEKLVGNLYSLYQQYYGKENKD